MLSSDMPIISTTNSNNNNYITERTFLIRNKVDLNPKLEYEYSIGNHSIPVINVSCITGEGVQTLEDTLGETVLSILRGGGDSSQSEYAMEEEGVLITRERHRGHVISCVKHLNVFLASQNKRHSHSSSDKDDLRKEEYTFDDDDDDEDHVGAVYMDAAAEELRYIITNSR